MFENLRARLALAVLPKAAQDIFKPFQIISTQPANIPVYTDMTVRQATREGYKISIYVYRAVRTIVQAASGIPWVVKDSKGQPIENHPFTQVWNKPNPEFSGQDNMEFIIAHQLLVGNSLIQPIIVGGKPREFWIVMPDLVRPIPSDVRGEWLKGWEVTSIDGKQVTVPAEQFVHFMQMDPGNPYWGIGPLMAAARTIDTDNEAQDTQKISMQHRGTPDGVFTHEAVQSQEQFEEATRQIRERFLNKDKRREPWVLGAGAKWQQMSLTPVEMDFIASRLSNKRDIAGAFGISPIFLGDLEQSSYNNMMEARKSLYEDVVIPLMDDIKSTLNLRIAPMYGDIVIAYDTSKIAALREDYTKKVEQAKNLWSMGVPFDQINARLDMGFDEFSGWDVGYLPMMLLPVGSPPPASSEDEPEKDIVDFLGLHRVKALNLHTEEQKAVYWKRIDRRRIGWWGVVNKKVLPMYEEEAKAVAKAIKDKDRDQMAKAAATAINNGRPEWEKLMTAILSAIIEDFGNDIAEDLSEPKSMNGRESKVRFDPTTISIRKWIVKHGAEDVVSILSTNLDDVKRVILAGVDENIGTRQIAMNLRKFYIDRSPFKAMRVARTEVTKASSFGSQEAARQSGVVEKKTWLTSRDDRVRDEHVAMEGESVGLNDNFSNGLEYPSEPMCRCVLTFQSR